jgi:hypothetical protein
LLSTNHYRLRQTLQLPQTEESVLIINEDLDELLKYHGFVREGRYGTRYVRQRPDREIHRRPGIQGHPLWTWNLIWHSGSVWIAPLLRHRLLSSACPAVPEWRAWLEARDDVRALCLSDGRRPKLRWFKGNLEQATRQGWSRCDPRDLRLTFSMTELRALGCSKEASASSCVSFSALRRAIEESPLREILTDPIETHFPGSDSCGWIRGERVEFRHGRGSHPKDIFRHGVAAPPQQICRIIPVIPARTSSQSDHRAAKDAVNGHLASRDSLSACAGGARALQSIGADRPGVDTLYDLWRRLGLPEFRALPSIQFYPETGTLLPEDQRTLSDIRSASQAVGETLIELVVVTDAVASAQHRELRQRLGAEHPVQIVRLETLKNRWAMRNLAVALAARIGAVPFRLVDLPGADSRTVFVGVDLGHHHARDFSNVALTLFNRRGERKKSQVLRCGRNDERIPSRIIREVLPEFIRTAYPNPSRVVVHRDGRFLQGEAEDFDAALAPLGSFSLVSVKKHPCTRLHAHTLEGAVLRLSDTRAILVSADRTRGRSMPCPLEIELKHAGGLSLGDAVRQVFWLCRTFAGTVSDPNRLPATTREADELASTGRARACGARTGGKS